MITKINTLGLEGINPVKIETEVDISPGFPRFEIIGMPDSSIKEARHRVKTAIQNSGIKLQSKRIIINLSPAEIKKVGSHYDLSIAIGILKSSNILKENRDLSKIAFIGELSLDGKLKRTKGILPLCLEAKKSGIEKIIVPYENLDMISIIDNIEILGAQNLNEVIKYLYSKIDLEMKRTDFEEILSNNIEKENYLDFADVKGQQEAKRALEIAVAGHHNCMIIGPPGNGKTMLAKRVLSIMPKLTYEEFLEINKISDFVENQDKLKTTRPFLNPHYSISKTGLIGGGNNPKPGVITLAHNGVLFLDELLEFDKNTLESLRNPLEDKEISLTRNNKKVTYPCNSLLILSTNPCKCGYRGSNIKECKCTNLERKKYREKLSGPITDRIDITIECSNIEYNTLKERKEESSKIIKKRIEKARLIQLERYKYDGITTNSELEEKHIKKYCKIDDETEGILKQTFKKYSLSIRSYLKILKIARTIADLDESKDIHKEHIIEAIKYKTNIYKYIEGE